jgi:outer membrane protein assembly factor BamB
VFALVLALVLLEHVDPAIARPVRIGRYVEIPYGFRAEDPCPTRGCDSRRSGRARGRFPDTAPSRLWRQQTAQPVFDDGLAPMVVLADDLVVVAELGVLEAFTRGGTPGFRAELGGGANLVTPAATPADELVAVTGRGEVLLVAHDGTVRSRARLPTSVRAAPLVLADGTIVLATGDGLRGLDATLAPVFFVPLDAGGAGAPSLLVDGRVVVGSGTELVLADAEGRGVTRVELGGRAVAHVAVAADGTLWSFAAPGELVAVDPSGRVRGRGANSRALEGAPALAPDGSARIFVRTGSGNTALAAITATGRTLWERELLGVPKGLATDDAGTTLVALRPPQPTGPGTTTAAPVGELVAIDASGEIRWRLPTEGAPRGAPVLGDDGALYLLVSQSRTFLESYH